MTIYQLDLTSTLHADLFDPAQAAAVWDTLHCAATLQGIVNRSAPRLYLRYVEWDGRNIDDYWLAELRRRGAWLEAAPIQPVESLEELVAIFRTKLAGAVVYDAQVAALSNVASTLAGVEDLVAVRYDPSADSVYSRLIQSGPRLPVKRRLTPATWTSPNSPSPKCGAYLRAKQELLDTGRCNPAYMAYYIDAYWIDHATRAVPNHHTLCNHDYFVAQRAFFCDLNCWDDERPVDDPHQPRGEDRRTLEAILQSHAAQNRGGLTHVGGFTPWAFKYTTEPGAGGTHEGVPTEWELVRVFSAYNAFLDADALSLGAMANASFFQHFPLAASYRQAPPPAPDELPAHGDFDWIMFYVGDYDSAAWLYQRVPDLWDDPQRGTVPLNWAISPVLSRRAPQALDRLYRTKSANDHFITADNGAGYLNPSMLPEPRPLSQLPSGLEAWRAHCAAYYALWDMHITGFVIDGRAAPMNAEVFDAYATFSPGGIVPEHDACAQRLHGSMPVLRRGPDINDESPVAAAARIVETVRQNRACGLRFHWFRSILRSPTWYARVVRELAALDARIRVVGAPVFFELLRSALARAGESE